MEENFSSDKKNEENILRIIKEAIRQPNLSPEDWKKYGPKVIKP
jgi:hypothetical protein